MKIKNINLQYTLIIVQGVYETTIKRNSATDQRQIVSHHRLFMPDGHKTLFPTP